MLDDVSSIATTPMVGRNDENTLDPAGTCTCHCDMTTHVIASFRRRQIDQLPRRQLPVQESSADHGHAAGDGEHTREHEPDVQLQLFWPGRRVVDVLGVVHGVVEVTVHVAYLPRVS
ncbi:MAG: hypothetical protein QOF58_1389 [Pseudonocardiales bacterium]|jgi:hypothetical protein|nr:hypothetical protein [Pseudonocardiales bacterium]